MAPRLTLAAWAGLAPTRPRRTRTRKVLTPEQQQEIAVERAHRCGFRYYARRWPRRIPPRFDCIHRPYHHPEQELRRACRAAFYRGYDDGWKAHCERQRAWAVTWPVAEAAE